MKSHDKLSTNPLRVILNGKKAGDEAVRSAIYQLRDEGCPIEVRTTWEAGDMERLIAEAIKERVKRLLIGGGDGSVNEAVSAVLELPPESRPELAILPLGTANDFASACKIPIAPIDALRLALTGDAIEIDAVRANDRAFMNVATAGIGAQITAETPEQLKNFLGGGAYTLMGLIKAVNFTPYESGLSTSSKELSGKVIVGAVCNGPQAGGGQPLAPDARINDGLIDVIAVLEFPAKDLDIVVKEILDPEMDGKYVKRLKVDKLQVWSDKRMPINLDGEPYKADRVEFTVLPKAIAMVLPAGCPLI